MINQTLKELRSIALWRSLQRVQPSRSGVPHCQADIVWAAETEPLLSELASELCEECYVYLLRDDWLDAMAQRGGFMTASLYIVPVRQVWLVLVQQSQQQCDSLWFFPARHRHLTALLFHFSERFNVWEETATSSGLALHVVAPRPSPKLASELLWLPTLTWKLSFLSNMAKQDGS